ncbi:MAG: M28 family peptidase [Oligoflexus sp.]|nr:M28 family peptidase [Oligoflexus sp.]
MRAPDLLVLSLFLMAGTCRPNQEVSKLPWNSERAGKDLKEISLEPHPMGSARIKVLADYLDTEMKNVGMETGRDSFTSLVPDPDLFGLEANPMRSVTLSMPMQNVFAKLKSGTDNCALLVASHYDSKRLPQGPSIGANDSGSSSVAILELMRGLKNANVKLRCHIVAVWFDGEESYLPEWRDGQTHHPARIIDNTYGSRHLADSLQACGNPNTKTWCLPQTWGGERVEGLILLDMVGMENLRLTPESHSTPALMSLAMELDKQMFAGQLFGNSSFKAVEDDHIPFLEKGIPSLDLIGFENLDTWHQPTDTFERVSMKSVQQAAELTAAIVQKLLGE